MQKNLIPLMLSCIRAFTYVKVCLIFPGTVRSFQEIGNITRRTSNHKHWVLLFQEVHQITTSPRIARTPSSFIPRLQGIQINNKSMSESQFFSLRHSNLLRIFAKPPSIEMRSLAPLSHQYPHNHSEKRPLSDLVELVARLSSTLRLPSSTRSTGHRLTTYSLRLLEYRNLRHSALSGWFVPQSPVSLRLAPVRNLCSPMQSAWYPADGRCPRPQEDRLDLRSFSGPGHSNWPLLQINWRVPLTDLDLHCRGQLGFRHHLLHDVSTPPASGTDRLVPILV